MIGTQNRLAWPVVSSDFWRDMHTLSGEREVNGRAVWRPAAMVAESNEQFTLRLEVPGVTAESLEVDLHGEHLTISGERPAPTPGEEYKILVSEAPWGRFQRRFRLGAEADRDGISATHREGLLEITVRKRQEARPKRIPVSTEA